MNDSLQTQTATITFIGAGNMASAIIKGLVDKGYPTSRIHAADPNPQILESLSASCGIQTAKDNHSAVRDADAVVLAVKPQVMEEVVKPLRDTLSHRPVVISIAAGVTLGNLSQWLGAEAAIVRTMPNIAALVQSSATGLCCNGQVDARQREITDMLFNAVGLSFWFEQESDLDKVVAVSGSGPGYFFMVMEAMQAAAENMGLSPQVARQLTLQTALGAAQLALSDDIESAEWRRRVTSPGGTTEQAIKCFQEGQLPALFEKAMRAAQARSIELAG